MKICLLADLHLDVKHYSETFHEYFEKFFDNIFFTKLKEENVDVVIQAGDMFDNKKQINFNSLGKIDQYFLNRFKQYNIKLHTLIGNHDCPNWKNTLKNNAQSKIIKNNYENIKYYDKPKTLNFGDLSFDIIPWICRDNEQEIFDFVSKSNSDYCIGHFEFSGFKMDSGYVMKEAMSTSIFSKYKKVFSGHFHDKQIKGNVVYLGTSYDLSWNDADKVKGFHIFDTKTEELEFIVNPHKMFNKIKYSDEYEMINPESLVGSYVRLIVEQKTNVDKFDKYVNEINKFAIDLDIIENTDVMVEDESEVYEYEDTKDTMLNYIKNISNKQIKIEKLQTMMLQLYDEAFQLELV